MRFGSIYLMNYAGIYNGMHLHEIFIDFTLCKNRTTIIRGDNGSGKSTLVKALTVFPDGYDMFMPGLPAKKTITLIDGPILYTIDIDHKVSGNGERLPSKAYVSKSINGSEPIQLNPNGNITSFKDILYDELGLDPNFSSLSQLSTEDRGIADKKPADRKRFVNSILNSLDVYNDIYKTLNKRAIMYKNLINSLSAKLGTLGDPQAIARNIEAVENRINIVQDLKDQAIEALAGFKAQINLLDPDGSIQQLVDILHEDSQTLKEKLTHIDHSISAAKLSNSIPLNESVKALLDKANKMANDINVENQINRGRIEALLREKESELFDMNDKIARLQTFDTPEHFEYICDQIALNEAELEEIKNTLQSTIGINDILSLSRDEYIMALEFIKELREKLSDFKDKNSYDNTDYIIQFYLNNGYLPESQDLMPLRRELSDIATAIGDIERSLPVLQTKIATLDKLKLRPDKCRIDTCPFIADAVEFEKEDPKAAYQERSEKLEILKTKFAEFSDQLQSLGEKNAIVMQFSSILNDIQRHKRLLDKIPAASIFTDTRELIRQINSGNYTEYMDTLYSYIQYANLFDMYKSINDILIKLYADKAVYESKQDALDQIQKDIEIISKRIDEIAKEVEPIQASLAVNDKKMISLSRMIATYTSIIENEKLKEETQEEIDKIEQKRNQNIENIRKIELARDGSAKQAAIIMKQNEQLSPLMAERDRLNHTLRMTDDYQREMDELNNEYRIIETIRYYSSPTTGIQLVFMEMYMGKIIEIANHLLSLFFGGQYTIMPFIINESEFRIPCCGEGIMNDDITSMSSAQIAMISMILSFSFLYNSSTKYNILKLDEIDGPLDSTNRLMFTSVLNQVMDMMGTEQCIMISHNTELQSDDCDLIVLRNSDNDYLHGNVIWKY